MAKFIKNTYFPNQSNTNCSHFPDVKSSDPFFEEITTLKCEGVITGFADGTFKANLGVTRGAAMKFVIQSLRARDGDSLTNPTKVIVDTSSPKQPMFVDLSPEDVFLEFIIIGYQNDVISGYSDNTFRSNEIVNRGAMSKIVHISSLLDFSQE